MIGLQSRVGLSDPASIAVTKDKALASLGSILLDCVIESDARLVALLENGLIFLNTLELHLALADSIVGANLGSSNSRIAASTVFFLFVKLMMLPVHCRVELRFLVNMIQSRLSLDLLVFGFSLTILGRQLSLQGKHLASILLCFSVKRPGLKRILMPLSTNLLRFLGFLPMRLLLGLAGSIQRLVDTGRGNVDGVLSFLDKVTT
jgi:hypothetical protein